FRVRLFLVLLTVVSLYQVLLNLVRLNLCRLNLGRLNLGRLDLGRLDLGRFDLGRVDLAKRTLLRGGVLPEVPSRADLETYEGLFPLNHRDLMEAAAETESLPHNLVAGLIYVESRFAPRAVSRAGAVGLMQLMPGTARVVGRKGLNRKITRRSLKDPKTNMTVGTHLLAELISHFRGNVPVALAAYNAGRGAARGWLRSRGHLPIDAFVETIPYTQARRYVRRVVASAAAYGAIHGIRGGTVRVPAHPPLTLDGFLEVQEGQKQ
ncbi:MAG: lytic transglycosylase domain-containing protein, partial [Myxococcota bacterium]|nr:lytic transglycosylase domain-containing protein [Myxococcota bacterium]